MKNLNLKNVILLKIKKRYSLGFKNNKTEIRNILKRLQEYKTKLLKMNI